MSKSKKDDLTKFVIRLNYAEKSVIVHIINKFHDYFITKKPVELNEFERILIESGHIDKTNYFIGSRIISGVFIYALRKFGNQIGSWPSRESVRRQIKVLAVKKRSDNSKDSN